MSWVADHRTHLQFAAAGTQYVTPTTGTKLLIQYIDITSGGITVTITMNGGAYSVLEGPINRSPAQINFGRGVGSGIIDDRLTIVTNGAANIYVGYAEIS